jgi:hypothetical protein
LVHIHSLHQRRHRMAHVAVQELMEAERAWAES